MRQDRGTVGSRKLWGTRRWLVVAPFLLLFWIIGQFDKANISLVIAAGIAPLPAAFPSPSPSTRRFRGVLAKLLWED
jgi:hypothetical protein